MDQRCAAMRSRLAERTDMDALRRLLYDMESKAALLAGSGLTPDELVKALFGKFANTLSATLSYMRFGFTPEIQERLRSVEPQFDGLPNTFAIYSRGDGLMRTNLMQTRDQKPLLRAFEEELQSQGIPVEEKEIFPKYDRLDRAPFEG